MKSETRKCTQRHLIFLRNDIHDYFTIFFFLLFFWCLKFYGQPKVAWNELKEMLYRSLVLYMKACWYYFEISMLLGTFALGVAYATAIFTGLPSPPGQVCACLPNGDRFLLTSPRKFAWLIEVYGSAVKRVLFTNKTFQREIIFHELEPCCHLKRCFAATIHIHMFKF